MSKKPTPLSITRSTETAALDTRLLVESVAIWLVFDLLLTGLGSFTGIILAAPYLGYSKRYTKKTATWFGGIVSGTSIVQDLAQGVSSVEGFGKMIIKAGLFFGLVMLLVWIGKKAARR